MLDYGTIFIYLLKDMKLITIASLKLNNGFILAKFQKNKSVFVEVFFFLKLFLQLVKKLRMAKPQTE